MLPGLPADHLAPPAQGAPAPAQGAKEEEKKEEKVLQLVGERDSQGRPHGEVKNRLKT